MNDLHYKDVAVSSKKDGSKSKAAAAAATFSPAYEARQGD
jgi:hypothetical protein